MNKPKYYISKDDKFVIENYNQAPTFSSFFPGIAGIYGIPMWVFYTNRGQCISSFGIHNKDGAISEFQPANKAYRTTSLTGFRTFIKIDGKFYEPFKEDSTHKNEVKINSYSFKLIETNNVLKIKIEIDFFTIPNESFPALARKVKVTNLSNKKRSIEILDGLVSIIPYGFLDYLLKNISQTISAWNIVENLNKNAPFYKLKVSPSDISETEFIEKGNFYIPISSKNNNDSSVKIIIDPKLIFGENTSFTTPVNFIERSSFNVPEKQIDKGYMPCAFSHKKTDLSKNEGFYLYSAFGSSENIEKLNKIKNRVSNSKYFDNKYKENKELILKLTSNSKVSSNNKNFDLYVQQTFLDNVMRGGLPVSVGNKVFYTYYRKHGDMERDYNNFRIMPTYFSQGNGNYRDINQNRRSDIFFNPQVKDNNIRTFYNLSQLDGYNPLVVLPCKYFIKDRKKAVNIVKKHIKNFNQTLVNSISYPFILGTLLMDFENLGIRYKTSKEKFVDDLINNAVELEEAQHGEGFWTDHYSYNLDLLESYEAVYPENISNILFKDKSFTFYDNDHVVLDRKDKYCINNKKVRQYKSVIQDSDKQALISGRKNNKNIVRTEFGNGRVYSSTLITKLLCTVANKAASLDPEGIGIEMESDKPNWYDALNGLPGLIGSSLSETLELKRLSKYILGHLTKPININIPIEINDLIHSINKEINLFMKSNDSFKYWDNTYSLKEKFRNLTKLGISGNEIKVNNEFIAHFLENVVKKCSWGIERSLKKYKNYYTYFINEAINFETASNGQINVKSFKQEPLPLFLEGFVHALKVEKDHKIYDLVKKSPLFDKKLKMYKVNSPLKDSSIEIGRTKVFTPGWLENESIWLHMEYKYLLELLKSGMYKEFYSDIKDALIPFTKPHIYKRSILENSSFLVSSAHPNTDDHGRGFVARLSGGSAEFLEMYVNMMFGKKLFYLDHKESLCFKLSPKLPNWLFKNGKLSFTLFGSTEVTYINKKNKNTFDKGISAKSYTLIINDKEVKINGHHISEPYSSKIRDQKIKKIIVTLA